MKKETNGITLVALVITIIILLILAGISISALTQTGLFGKAKQAEQKSNMADAKEKITLIEYEWQLESTSNPEATLENFLNEKVADQTIDEYKKLDNGNYEVYVNGYVGTLDSNGKLIGEVEKAGPRPTISNITIKSEDGTTDAADNSQKPGAKLQINFNASIENGTIKSVTPAVPYTTNGTDTEVTFTITGTVDGTDYTTKKKVSVANKYQEPFEGTTVEEAIKYGDMLNSSKNKELKDAKNNKIVIPAGFKVTSDATTVDKGIVVEDATGKATNGSQFVWVPVGTITKADGSTTTINLDRYTFDAGGKPTPQGDKVVEKNFSETASKGNTVAKSITNFKNSVATKGGYYIGRYEARTVKLRDSEKNPLTQITVKRTDPVYNYVTQIQAASQSQNMYDNTHSFTSDLMNSYAWDTATVFIQSCGTNSKYSRQDSLNQSLSSTGTKNDVQCNIYDIASNVREWTTETCHNSSLPCVLRGGTCLGSNVYTSYRQLYSTSGSGSYDGFRPILYVNN